MHSEWAHLRSSERMGGGGSIFDRLEATYITYAKITAHLISYHFTFTVTLISFEPAALYKVI